MQLLVVFQFGSAAAGTPILLLLFASYRDQYSVHKKNATILFFGPSTTHHTLKAGPLLHSHTTNNYIKTDGIHNVTDFRWKKYVVRCFRLLADCFFGIFGSLYMDWAGGWSRGGFRVVYFDVSIFYWIWASVRLGWFLMEFVLLIQVYSNLHCILSFFWVK